MPLDDDWRSMGKVRQIGSAIKSIDTRTALPPPKQVDPLYLTPEYGQWREKVLINAGRQCEHVDPTTSIRCQKAEPFARIFADHIDEIKDGGSLFDPANGRALCGSHHVTKTNIVRKQRSEIGATHPAWLRPSLVPLVIVAGPPASGKSTYVASHSTPADLILDLDVIAATLSGSTVHNWDRSLWLDRALRERNRLLGDLSTGPKHTAAWLIVGEPEASKREWWASKLHPTEVIVVATPERTCEQRIIADEDRAYRRREALMAVSDWWTRYQPRCNEREIITQL